MPPSSTRDRHQAKADRSSPRSRPPPRVLLRRRGKIDALRGWKHLHSALFDPAVFLPESGVDLGLGPVQVMQQVMQPALILLRDQHVMATAVGEITSLATGGVQRVGGD